MEDLHKEVSSSHHHVDEMTCRDDEKMRMRRNGLPCHDHFEEDDRLAVFIGLNRDLPKEIKNESWNNRFVDFKETIKANVCEETLDVVGFVVGLINNTSFVNVAIFNRFVEFGNSKANARDFGYFRDVGFSKGYIDGSSSWHFFT
ncbi:hypothetical protein Tco_1291744 [Tanacetum coccineum]